MYILLHDHIVPYLHNYIFTYFYAVIILWFLGNPVILFNRCYVVRRLPMANLLAPLRPTDLQDLLVHELQLLCFIVQDSLLDSGRGLDITVILVDRVGVPGNLSVSGSDDLVITFGKQDGLIGYLGGALIGEVDPGLVFSGHMTVIRCVGSGLVMKVSLCFSQ